MFDFLHAKTAEGKASRSPDKGNVKTTEKPPRASISFCFKKCRFIAEEEIKPQKVGDAFMLDERMTDYGDLPFEPTEQGDAENGVWMRDVRNGRFVLHFSESIPTFDSGDRIYDSAAKWYFMCENGNISILNLHHGYQLGSVRVYRNIRAENDAAAAIIRRIHDKYGIKAQEVKGMNNETRSRR